MKNNERKRPCYSSSQKSFNDETPSMKSPNEEASESAKDSIVRTNTNISEFNLHNQRDTIDDIRTVPLCDYDKLKDDYVALLSEKNKIESEMSEIEDARKDNEKLTLELHSLKEYSDNLHEYLTQKESDINVLHEQIAQFSREKDELNETVRALREQLKSSENEKTEIKIKNAHHFSKFKLMEKDIATLRKKNNELSRNVKCLIEKIEGFKEDKVEMKKIYEKKIQDMENKVEVLENEKKKMSKDVLATLIENTMKKQNLVTFAYNAEHNTIGIKYAGELIGEVKNEIPKVASSAKKEIASSLSYMKKNDINSPFNINKEASVYRYRQLTQCNNVNTFSSSAKKSIKSPAKNNVSLRKLFSNNNFSISSRKSLVDSLNKENINTDNIGLNLISLNPNSFAEKLQNDIITVNNFNKEISLTNCINKINIDKKENKEFDMQKETFSIEGKKKQNMLMIQSNVTVIEEVNENVIPITSFAIEKTELNFEGKIRKKHIVKCDDILGDHASYYHSNYMGNAMNEIKEEKTNESNKIVETLVKKEESQDIKNIKRGTCCQCILI